MGENKLELSFDVYSKTYIKRQTPFVKRWKKDKYLSERLTSLEDIEKQMQLYPEQERSGNYHVLERVREKKGSIIYTFRVIPGYRGDAIKDNHPTSYTKRKVVPRIKLKGDKK